MAETDSATTKDINHSMLLKCFILIALPVINSILMRGDEWAVLVIENKAPAALGPYDLLQLTTRSYSIIY